jgi:hypothetical protein
MLIQDRFDIFAKISRMGAGKNSNREASNRDTNPSEIHLARACKLRDFDFDHSNIDRGVAFGRCTLQKKFCD